MPQVNQIPARNGRLRQVRPARRLVDVLQAVVAQVFHDLRHDFLGLTENEMLNLGKSPRVRW